MGKPSNPGFPAVQGGMQMRTSRATPRQIWAKMNTQYAHTSTHQAVELNNPEKGALDEELDVKSCLPSQY